MTIDFGFDVGNDPKHDNNQTLTDDGFLNMGGQCVYVGVTPKQVPQPRKTAPPVARKPDSDDDWIFFDTHCVYVGKS